MNGDNLEKMIRINYAIVSSVTSSDFYISIIPFVDKDLLKLVLAEDHYRREHW